MSSRSASVCPFIIRPPFNKKTCRPFCDIVYQNRDDNEVSVLCVSCGVINNPDGLSIYTHCIFSSL